MTGYRLLPRSLFNIHTNVSDAFESIWLTLTSDVAIYVYLIAVLLLILIALLLMMTNEFKRHQLSNNEAGGSSEDLLSPDQEKTGNASRFSC